MQLPHRRRIVLMRHGEVDYFVDGKPVPTELAQLNADGRAQALAAGAALAATPIDRAIVSGLPRTVETATLALGGRAVPLETRAELAEIRSGRIGSLPRAERAALFVRSLADVTDDGTFLLGDRWGDFRDRVRAAFDAILDDNGWTTLLIVAHGATNRVIMTEALGAPLAMMAHLEQDPACINLIDVDDAGHPVARLVNYTPYDPLKRELTHTTMERYLSRWPEERPDER